MAAKNVTVSFRVKDADGEIFSLPIYGNSEDSHTLLQLQGDLTNLATLVDAVLDGQVISAGICVDMDISLATIKANPVAGSEIERTGLVPFGYGSPPRTWSADIPAFAYAKFLTGTNQINMADTDVAALVSAILLGGNILFTDPARGFRLTTVGQGTKTFRKHRRQTKRT